MTQMVIVNGMTAHRANVIARRTGSESMGVVKAQMIDLLKAKLQNATKAIWNGSAGISWMPCPNGRGTGFSWI